MDKKSTTIPPFCPNCGVKDRLVVSHESFTDYYVVGETFRCAECGAGFGFVLEPETKPNE